MSNIPECINGGISITWKIRNFSSLPHLWKTTFPLKWWKMNSKWEMEIKFFNKEGNKRMIVFQTSKLDDFEPNIISGTIYLVEKSELELSRFDKHNLRENGNKKSIWLTPFEGIDWEADNLVNNDVLTIRINLWDPNINDVVAAEYFIYSSCPQQMFSFHWTIKKSDWRRKEIGFQCSIDAPEEITELFTMQTFNLKFSLRKTHRSTMVGIRAKDSKSEHFRIHCSYKLEFQCNEGITLPFSDTGWNQILLSDDELEGIVELTHQEWDHLSTDLVVKVEFVIISDCRGVIERICLEPYIQHINEKLPIQYDKLFSKYNLQYSMYKLYKQGKFCDLALQVGDETFLCHKAVLCARSPVFNTMFESDMVEKETNVVNVTDVEPRIMGMFLTYLYSEDLENEDFDLVFDLYIVADKYEVLDLRRKCANFLILYLSIDNICEVLNLADSHQDEDLKKETLLYFNEHNEEIVNSSFWEKFLTINPLLAAETLEATTAKFP